MLSRIYFHTFTTWTTTPRSTTISRKFEFSIVRGDAHTDISGLHEGASHCGAWHYQGVGLSQARRRRNEHLSYQDPASHRWLQRGTAGRKHRSRHCQRHKLRIAPPHRSAREP